MHSLSVFLISLVPFGLALQSTPLSTRSGSSGPVPYSPKTPPLDTPWTDLVGTDPWPQYPRPKLQRSQWQSLNGIGWTYQNESSLDALKNPPFNQTLANQVLIPSCLESGLSGIQTMWNLYSWFSTHFTVPQNWTGDQVLLNFGAVDYEATVFVNGHQAGFNRGGYFAFTIDVTQYLNGGDNELLVFVHDPTDSGEANNVIAIGKQTLRPSHIFYRPCSGIWQSVWIESAPSTYIADLNINGDADGILNLTVSSSSNTSSSVQVTVYERGTSTSVASQTGSSDSLLQVKVPSAKLWSPDSPNLYDVEIALGDDKVKSYTGFRTISRGAVNGIQRIMLNGEPIFPIGTLDQGYWPDGIYTPPTYKAMVFDIQTLKNLSFNMLRKHMKVEHALYYTACDEIGIMVIQDMPALRPLSTETFPNCTTETILPDAAQQAEWQRQLEVMVKQQRVYTCTFTYVIYNEGWGQTFRNQPSFTLTNIVNELDPTRLVDATSGWYDTGAGDFSDNHHYSSPQCGSPFYSINSSPFDPARIGFQGEFGGLGNNVSAAHLWKVPEAIATINQTYELDATIPVWNYRAHVILSDLLDQVRLFACSGAVYTQTTDVEGEVNGLLTYDRRVLRPNVTQWHGDIQALYAALAERTNASMSSGGGVSSVSVEASWETPWQTPDWFPMPWTGAGPPIQTGSWRPGVYDGVGGGHVWTG